jgi:hypothetical protein
MIRFKSRADHPNQSKSAHRTLRRIAGCVAALIAAMLTTNQAWALPSCPVGTAIKECCVADQPGQFYAVGSFITHTGTCFKISAPNVFFLMGGITATGTGTGIGIHVLSTAPNAAIDNCRLQGFATGFKSDAPNTFVYGAETDLNERGMILNGPSAFVILPVAKENSKTGITLTPAATGSYLLGADVESNNRNGIVLRGTTGATLRLVYSWQNVGYGLWLKGASFNSVVQGGLEGNTIAGAYLGCHAGGPSPAACAIPPSHSNSFDGVGTTYHFIVGSCPGGTQANQPYGIAIDKGNGQNHVFSVSTDRSSSCPTPGDILYDGYDGNGANCNGNVWYSNGLAKKNHPGTLPHLLCID